MNRSLLVSLLGLVLSGCGASFDPSPRELCAAFAQCTPGTNVEMCVTSSQPEFDRAASAGCVNESNVANRCALNALRADGGSCSLNDLSTRCAAAYAPLSDCLARAGRVGPRACLIDNAGGRSCTTYAASTNGSSACAMQMGTPMNECPTAMRIGRCTLGTGTATATLDYYEGSPVTVPALMNICTMANGVWSVP